MPTDAREEMEALIERCRRAAFSASPLPMDTDDEEMLLKLARLGAKVMAPSEAEIDVLTRIMVEVDDKQTGHQRAKHMLTAALQVLKDSQ
jgi:hypothetical protein